MYLLHPLHLVFMIYSGKTIHLERFIGKKLDNAHPGNTFLQEGVYLCQLCTQFSEDLPCQGAKQKGQGKNKGEEGETYKGQPPVEIQQNRQDTREDKNILEDSNNYGLKHLIKVFDVISYPRYQTSHRVSIEKTHCLRLHPSEQMETDVLHNILACQFQEIIFRIAEPE